jgi:hypothetical protein
MTTTNEMVATTAVVLCEEHGVCSVGRRRKACLPCCVILRSDHCIAHVAEPGGWGFRQCARRPLGNGLCRQHGAAQAEG